MKTFSARETVWLQELDGIELASFWQRAAAFLIDVLIVVMLYGTVLSSAITLYVNRYPHSTIASNLAGASHKLWFTINEKTSSQGFEEELHKRLIEASVETVQGILVPILYFGLLLRLWNGRTLGKRLLRIRVVSLVHAHITFWHAAERAVGYGAALLECGFGFFQFFIHPYRRCAQDRLAETIVVTERSYQSRFSSQVRTPVEPMSLL